MNVQYFRWISEAAIWTKLCQTCSTSTSTVLQNIYEYTDFYSYKYIRSTVRICLQHLKSDSDKQQLLFQPGRELGTVSCEQGWEYRYSNIDITEIPKLFSVIFWIPKYRNSSKANFGIIPKFKQSQFRFIRNWQSTLYAINVWQALPHINKLMYSTIHYRVCTAAHSAQRVANRFLNKIFQWQFSRLFPKRSDTVNAVCKCVENSHLHIIAKSIRNTLCAVSCNAYSILYSVYSVLYFT